MLKNEKEGVYVVLINGVPHQDAYTSLQDACACGDVSYQLATRKKQRSWLRKDGVHVSIHKCFVVRIKGRERNRCKKVGGVF